MIKILENISLKKFNTFGIDVNAKQYISVNTLDELKTVLLETTDQPKFILGGGSNILLTKDLDALVIHNNIKGIEILSKNSKKVRIKVAAGENWHEFVLWCLEHDYGGIENLSLIPGNVGTAPIQNIGAYGVELQDVFVCCETIEISTTQSKTFSKEECIFDYRNSIFKQGKKGIYIITSVTFELTNSDHQLKTSYGVIKEELQNQNIKTPTIRDISNAVIAIRQSKLPDPSEIGNSGSFFKNPIINVKHYEQLQQSFPQIPSYHISKNEIKIPAGWLIETAGFKGKTFNNYGVHKNQALVLVNYGGADGNDLLQLSKLIQSTVRTLFEINLEAEVNIL